MAAGRVPTGRELLRSQCRGRRNAAQPPSTSGPSVSGPSVSKLPPGQSCAEAPEMLARAQSGSSEHSESAVAWSSPCLVLSMAWSPPWLCPLVAAPRAVTSAGIRERAGRRVGSAIACRWRRPGAVGEGSTHASTWTEVTLGARRKGEVLAGLGSGEAGGACRQGFPPLTQHRLRAPLLADVCGLLPCAGGAVSPLHRVPPPLGVLSRGRLCVDTILTAL